MQSQVEKRQSFREPTFMAGVAVMDNGLVRTAVTLLNLSRTGAMIEVSRPTHLDPDFTLLFKNSLAPCRIVWRQDNRAGVQFHASP